MKNPNGYGSVYKLSGNRRRPYIAVSAAYSVPGSLKPKKDIIGYYEKRADAMLALAQYNQSPEQRANITKEITLKTLYKQFISSKRFTKISRQTQDNYKAAWNYLSALGEAKVQSIKTAHLQQVIDEAERQGKSNSTLSKIRILESLLFQYAIQNDYAVKNYALFVELPKEEKKEKTPFTELELKKIEQAAANGVMYADLIYLLCLTGWRINEFLNLKQENYNPKENTLTGGLKTNSGKNRVVPVSGKALPYLLKWINKGGEYIVCREQDKKLVKVTDKYFRNEWYYPTLETLGLPRLTPHATRHTFASILHKNGVDKWDIQRLMGHSSPDITNKVYTHIDVEQLQKAVGQI